MKQGWLLLLLKHDPMGQEIDVDEIGRHTMLFAEESDDPEPVVHGDDPRDVFRQELIVTVTTDENARFTHLYRPSLSEA